MLAFLKEPRYNARTNEETGDCNMRNIKVKMYDKKTSVVLVEADYRVIESAKMIGVLKNIIMALISKTSGQDAVADHKTKIDSFIDNHSSFDSFEINGHCCEISA